jgi:nicotinate-nucleotide pyrophosphorylase (carboxylating)
VTAQIPESAAAMIKRAYEEDLAEGGDVTSAATVPQGHQSVARIIVRAPGCVAGIPIVEMCLSYVDDATTIVRLANDGDIVDGGTCVLEASGSTRSLLTAERVALNFLAHLSGIATATSTFVKAVKGTGAAVSDTRKTTPGLRALEKYAVAMGGGVNHRMGLYDAVLIKDNHLVASPSIAAAVASARTLVGTDMTVEVEVDTLDQLSDAIEADVDVVLLDNMTTAELTEAVQMVNGKMRTEASGGVTLQTARAIAETGVDVISIGWLTHSAPALDVAMDLVSA